MRGYSENEVFTEKEKQDTDHALLPLVEGLPSRFEGVRCHELARACSALFPIDTDVVDGHYDAVEHSWLRTFGLPRGILRGLKNVIALSILDVYAVGRVPMVQLVEVRSVGLARAHGKRIYRAGKTRDDIDERVVADLFREMNSRWKR